MIIDQLFTPKPLKEGGPYDLPGKDYDRPGDTPRKQSSGEQNPYPYSPEEDDDYFREIFRKKRETAAKDQGMAEASWNPVDHGDFPVNYDADTAQDAVGVGDASKWKAMTQYYSHHINVTRALDDLYRAVGSSYYDPVHKPVRFVAKLAHGYKDGSTETKYFDTKDAVYQYAKSYGRTVLSIEKVDTSDDDSGLIKLPVLLGVGTHKKKWILPFPDENYAQKWQFKHKNIADIQWPAGHALAEGSGQDSKSWMASIQQQYPDVRFVQAKMPGAPIMAMVNGKPVAQWDGKADVVESKRNKQRKLNEALELYFGKNSKPISEGNRNNQLRLMEETTFRNGYAFARLLVEKNLTKDQVLQLFKDVEQGATDAGGNRTGLGKAKDATTQAIGSVQKMLSGARKWVKERPTYQAVDAEYNRAMTALGKVGGDSGEANAVTKAIYKYRDMAKKYPRATGLAKWAIISAAGFLTGGLGGAGVAAGLAAIDSALKDKEIIDIVSDAGYAAAVGGAIQGAGDLASAASDAYNGMPSASDVGSTADPGAVDTGSQGNQLTPQQQLDAGVDRFEIEAAQNWVNADPAVRAEIEKILQLTPDEIQKIADSNLPRLGGTGPSDVGALADPGSTPGMGAGFAGGQYTVQDGDQIGYIAQAMGVKPQDITGLNPQIDFTKPLKLGTVLDLPQQGDNAGNLWTDYVQGSNYGDKVPGATGGRQFDLPTADAAQNAAVDAQVAADYAAAGPAEKAEIIKTTGMTADQLDKMAQQAGTAPIDYRKPGPVSTDSLGQKLEYGMPVNDKGDFVPPNPSLPAEELAKQTAAYDAWKADFTKRFPEATLRPDGTMQAFKPINLAPMYPGMTPKTFESVKFKVIPAEQLIDQKLTVLNWALNESVNRKGHQSVHLTTKGVRTVFENIGRCRRAYLKEYIGAPTADYGHPTAAGAPASATAGQGKPQGWFGKTLDTIGRGVDKVGSYVSNVGHNVITKVTADKLNNMWNRAGEPYDSDRLYQLLTTDWGVPKQVVDSVFSKMGIPYTAPATQPTAQTADQTDAQAAAPAKTGGGQTSLRYGINPVNGKPLTATELRNRAAARREPATVSTGTDIPTAPTTTAPATGTFPGEDPTGPGYVGRREVARRQAARDAEAAKKPARPNFAQQGGGYKSVTYAPNIKTGANLPKPTAPAAPTTTPTKTPTKTPTQAERDAYVRSIGAPAMAENRIAAALKRPLAEMLQMVETKEDVQKIKQFVDDTFVRYGAVNESAFAVRNQILEQVTQAGAQRRREHSQRVAH